MEQVGQACRSSSGFTHASVNEMPPILNNDKNRPENVSFSPPPSVEACGYQQTPVFVIKVVHIKDRTRTPFNPSKLTRGHAIEGIGLG